MRMPAGERAWVPIAKLERYLLDPAHPEGSGKATLFRRLPGITAEHAEVLRDALLRAAETGEVLSQQETSHGIKYRIDFTMESQRGSYTVVSIWIREQHHPPRLVTAYVK